MKTVVVTCRGVYESNRVEFVGITVKNAKSEEDAKRIAQNTCQRNMPSAIFWVAEFVEEDEV